MDPFRRAVRSSRLLRVAITGVAGAGKTWTALAMSHAVTDKVAVVDTADGDSEIYQGIGDWDFSVICPQEYGPNSLVELIARAEDNGYGAVIIDSLSDYWSGKGGMLELADYLKTNADPRSGWKAVKPDERALIKKIKSANLHIIATMRVTTEYSKVRDENTGRESVQKWGLKPEQRGNIDGDFDLVLSMSPDHIATVEKSRIPPLDGQVFPRPDGQVAITAMDWLSQGQPKSSAVDYRDMALTDGMNAGSLVELYRTVQHDNGMEHVTVVDANGGAVSLGTLILDRIVALTGDMTADSLVELYRKVQHEGMEYTAVADNNGRVVPLGKMILEIGTAARARENGGTSNSQQQAGGSHDRAVQRARNDNADDGDLPQPVGEIMRDALPRSA